MFMFMVMFLFMVIIIVCVSRCSVLCCFVFVYNKSCVSVCCPFVFPLCASPIENHKGGGQLLCSLCFYVCYVCVLMLCSLFFLLFICCWLSSMCLFICMFPVVSSLCIMFCYFRVFMFDFTVLLHFVFYSPLSWYVFVCRVLRLLC